MDLFLSSLRSASPRQQRAVLGLSVVDLHCLVNRCLVNRRLHQWSYPQLCESAHEQGHPCPERGVSEQEYHLAQREERREEADEFFLSKPVRVFDASALGAISAILGSLFSSLCVLKKIDTPPPEYGQMIGLWHLDAVSHCSDKDAFPLRRGGIRPCRSSI